MTLIIFILICYGITNIITTSSIFAPFRKWVEDRKLTCQIGSDDPKGFVFFEKIWYILSGNFIMNCRRIDLLEKHRKLLHSAKSAEDIDYYTDSIEELQKCLQDDIDVSLFKSFLKFWTKVDQLVNCQMCTGFWIGVFVGVLFSFGINLFGITIFTHPQQNEFIYATSLFLHGCISSGTCWIIHNIVARLERE